MIMVPAIANDDLEDYFATPISRIYFNTPG
jgi:hypothetical protein